MPPLDLLAMVAAVNGETGPSTPATDSSATTSPAVFPIEEMGKKTEWKLMLYPAHLALEESPGNPPYLVLRDQVMKTATLIEGIRSLALSQPRKLTFKLTAEATRALADWIGKPLLAGFYLRRRYAWVMPIAVVWIFTSIPIRGDAAAGIASVPFDPVGLVLGLTLIVSWALAKWRPHPVLFLVDSVWFLVMAGRLAMTVAEGRSKGWLVLVAMLLWMVVTGLKHFMRFRGTRIAPW